MTRRTAIVLQARMGSARLPGKVLAPLGDRTVLAHCLLRLDMSGLPIIVATTERPEDDAVEAAARDAGVEVFRGQTNDVLGRYIGAARAFGAIGQNPPSSVRRSRQVGRIEVEHRRIGRISRPAEWQPEPRI